MRKPTSFVPRFATLREYEDETNGFPPGNEAEDRQSERLFTPQAAEASRIHPSYPVAAAAWSCLSSEKIKDKKNIHRNLDLRQKTFPKDVGINCYAKKYSNKV